MNENSGHDYSEHEYLGHENLGREYSGHEYPEREYSGHEYPGREYLGHEYSRHAHSGHENMVECHYKGTIIYISTQMFISMAMRQKYEGQKYIRYKDAPKVFGMSLSSFKRFIEGSDCIYRPRPGVVLINVEKVDELLEYNRENY